MKKVLIWIVLFLFAFSNTSKACCLFGFEKKKVNKNVVEGH